MASNDTGTSGTERRDIEKHVDYLVIGAGPAGLQLGYFLERLGRDYSILERGPAPGNFFRTFPRHRQMISINKPNTGFDDPELNLRWDWNSLLSDDPELRFTRYTGRYFPDANRYLDYLSDFSVRHKLRVRCDSKVTTVSRTSPSSEFLVATESGERYRAKRVIAAVGFTKPYVPDIPGIETTERYDDVAIDPADFKGQRVLLIGKGNSAFETADNLTEHAALIHIAGPSSLKFAWRTHFIGHLRAVNNNFLDTYQLKTQNSVLDCVINRIELQSDGRYLVKVQYLRRDESAEFLYDRVISCTGFRMDPDIFASECRPKLTIKDRFPELTHEWESVNVPDLYFAGTLTQSRDFKKYTSAFIHGFRYGIRALTHILDQKYEGISWPFRELPIDPKGLSDAILARLNRTSALFQQFHFMSDLVIVEDGKARYYEEIPVGYVAASDFGEAPDYFTVTLEYGPGHDTIDPFDIEVGRRWEDTHKTDDRYLHPVVRHYRSGELIGSLRLKEDLENNWTSEECYRAPINEFIAASLAGETTKPEVAPVFLNVREFEPAAREKLDPVYYDYFAGGAQDEASVRANEQGFAELDLVPRILRGIGAATLPTSLLGSETDAPILLAPTAFHKLAHPEGELVVARAAAATNTILISAMLSTVSIEGIAAEARKVAENPQIWMQLYLQPDLEFMEAILRRAESAGVGAFAVTVDSQALGRAERGDRNDFHDLPPDIKCENLRFGARTGHVRSVVLTPEISWQHLDWLRSKTDKPLILKGVLHPADAELAVEYGVDAIYVSNHGGRQLDGAPAGNRRLSAITEVIGGRIPVLLDGGIRRGTDIAKALALGADAVAVGRPILWGLAADGERGVLRVLDILRAELAHTLTLCGVERPEDLARDQVVARPC